MALWAATAGYMLDAMDVLLYVFALQTIRAEFGLTAAQAGLAGSVSLAASAIGGILAGMLCDRIGRRRTLIYTILVYSLASAGSATSTGLVSLCIWRGLVGLGLGGEWSAGAVLVAESWPAEHRAKAIGFMQSGWALGYMLAAGVTALVLPHFGWRALFLVGLLPALSTVWIRRKVTEPEIWTAGGGARGSLAAIFRAPLLRRTVLATSLASSVLLAYWALFFWLPGFLSAPREQGGGGMTITSTGGFMIAVQVGALLGYWSFGFLADRFGRRPAFLFYVLGAAVVAPVYGRLPSWLGDPSAALLALGPLVGFFGTGYFSLFGAMLAELYPTAVRGSGQGFTYNFGRCLAAAAPYLVGAIADRSGFGAGLALSSGFFLLAAALSFTLPETRRTRLEEVAPDR